MTPLRFQPIFRRYLWGGRRLGTVLGKPIGPEEDYAESWEIVDHGEDQTVVACGPLAGQTLGQLVRQRGAELFGRHASFNRFPLLFKLLDANRDLSVQVHPNDQQAAQLQPPDLGKTEAWIILDAQPRSRVYVGLKRGFDRDALAREVARGTTELCLHSFEPQIGDCIFVPAGTVHALGGGLLVAEIQQSSDTTFRLFDWNRLGTDGQPRPLHVQQALQTIDYQQGPVAAQVPQATESPFAEELVSCEKFVLRRWRLTKPESLGGDDRFRILSVVSGALAVESDPSGQPLQPGQTLLIPAAVGQKTLQPESEAEFLEIYLP
jgi:mannose-6-phosphate isomerase